MSHLRRIHPLPSVLAAAALVAALPACGEERAPDSRSRAAAGRESGGPAVPAAEYTTLLAFLPRASSSPGALLWLRNRTSDSLLSRRYLGWEAGPGRGWRPVLDVEDRAPVPRAGWRLVPGGGLRVLVDSDGELAGLRFGGDSARRLDLGTALTGWRGSTGQPASLRRATLAAGDSAASGTAAVLRFDRLLRESGPAGPARLLLAVGSRGEERGVLALGDGSPGTPWYRAWSWEESRVASWSVVNADSLDPEAADEAGRWGFSIPGRGPGGSFEWTGALRYPAGGGAASGGAEARGEEDADERLLLLRGEGWLEWPGERTRAAAILLLRPRAPSRARRGAE